MVEEARRRRQAAQSTPTKASKTQRQWMALGVIVLAGILMVAFPAIIPLVLVLGAIIGWVVWAAWIGLAAQAKGRDYTAFFFLALFVTPLLMALIVACMTKPPSTANISD